MVKRRRFQTFDGSLYEIVRTTCPEIVDDPSTQKVKDGDTRVIHYVAGPLKGREIEQVFGGGPLTGGWFDVD